MCNLEETYDASNHWISPSATAGLLGYDMLGWSKHGGVFQGADDVQYVVFRGRMMETHTDRYNGYMNE